MFNAKQAGIFFRSGGPTQQGRPLVGFYIKLLQFNRHRADCVPNIEKWRFGPHQSGQALVFQGQQHFVLRYLRAIGFQPGSELYFFQYITFGLFNRFGFFDNFLGGIGLFADGKFRIKLVVAHRQSLLLFGGFYNTAYLIAIVKIDVFG